MTRILLSSQYSPEDLRRAVTWMRGLGICWLVLAVLAVGAVMTATLATVAFIGVILLLAGVAQLAQVGFDRSAEPGWRAGVGALYALAGVLLLVDPRGGAVGLTLLLAIFFLLGGIVRLVMASAVKRRGRPAGLQTTSGVVNLALAVIIVAGWPQTATWVVGLLVGVELLIGGAFMLLAKTLAEVGG